ncbi:hypothetical protein LEMLEM_LOCUS4546 [Lemmus lemmus]
MGRGQMRSVLGMPQVGGHFITFFVDQTTVDTFFAHQQDWRLGSHGDSDIESGGSSGALGTKIHCKFPICNSESLITEHFWPTSVNPFTKKLDRSLLTRTPTSAGVKLTKVFPGDGGPD